MFKIQRNGETLVEAEFKVDRLSELDSTLQRMQENINTELTKLIESEGKKHRNK